MLTLRNVIFLTVLSTVWAAAHVYVGRRLLTPLVPDPAARRRAWALVAFAWALGPLTFLATPFTGDLRVDAFERVGFVAMGFFSILFALVVLGDLAMLAARGLARLRGSAPADPGRRALLARVGAGASLGLSGLLTAIGYARASHTAEVERVELPVPGLPPALDGFRIVQISDVHVGPTIRTRELAAIVDRVNALAPDLVAITGDLVDGAVERIASRVAPLASLRATHGAFFCTGNHEYYSGADAWCDEVARIGVRVLDDANALVEHGGARLLVAGVRDPEGVRFGKAPPDPRAALAGAPPHDFSVLLAHRPETVREATSLGVGLQLSGHTHGGQYFPYTYVVRLALPFDTGLHRVGDTFLYVNRGTTYWGPPIRLGAPQEITLLTLRRA